MSLTACPVQKTLDTLKKVLETGAIIHPRSVRLTQEMETVVRDIASGRAGRGHMASLEKRAGELSRQSDDPNAMDTAQWVLRQIQDHPEVFRSHVKTHNCPSGDCDYLTPAPCQMACPAGIDVPTYVSLIGMGKDAEAISIIRRDNPFPWVCGLVCTRPCELMCVRGRIDTPISIKTIKAFAAERAMSRGQYLNPDQAPPNHRKVCIIGAGPGGLTAAYYLALRGYRVFVIEALPKAGGMLAVGIPRYRLPADVIDREVDMIASLGVTFSFNTCFGSDIDLKTLRKQGFEAFFFAIGAHDAYKLGIMGENAFSQVYNAVEFLRRVSFGERRKPGRRVIIIGGGNVAIDAARTCLRLGCGQVTLIYRRTRDEMPADVEEVEQAEEEGVRFCFLTVPTAVEGRDGKVTGLNCLKAKLVSRQNSDRKVPKPIEGSEHVLHADAVITAIGQRVAQHWLNELSGLDWSHRDTIRVHTATMATNLPGIFAAGDAVTGPATVIEAIGGGKRAAQAIHRYLQNIPQPQLPPVPVRRRRVEWTRIPAVTKMTLKRPEMPLLNVDRRRTTFQQVELGHTENEVREESRRCLRCDICRRCGRCVTVCRDQMGVDALKMGYLAFDHTEPTDFRHTQERCIGCGACAANCPTGAMRIDDLGNERLLLLCGTVLSRQRLVCCSLCEAVIGPERYIAFIRNRLEPKAPVLAHKTKLCDTCARKQTVTPMLPAQSPGGKT